MGKGMLKARTGQEQGLLRQRVSPVVRTKETFLKEAESATRVNPQMIRKWNSLIADGEKDQTDTTCSGAKA